jgi:hypothetical protein
MTSSLDAGGQAREALSEVAAQAPEALVNASMLANLLKDLLPDAPREAGVLVNAVQAGASDLLRDRAHQVGGQLAAVQVAGMLEERTGLSTPACQWAVTELAVALGMLPGAAPGPSVPEPPAPGGAGQWVRGAPTVAPGSTAGPAGGQWAGSTPGGPAPSVPGSQPGGQWAGGAPTVGPGGPEAPAPRSQPGGQWAGGTPTIAPGSYGQGPTVYGQPGGGGAVYGQGAAGPGFYGQGPAATGAPPATGAERQSGGLAVTAGVAAMLGAVIIAWYSFAVPYRLGTSTGTWFALEGLATAAAGVLAVIPGRVRPFGVGAAFGTATYLCGQASWAASGQVGVTGYGGPGAAAVLGAVISLVAVVASVVFIVRTVGLSARDQGGLAAAWVVAAIVYVVVWVPDWYLFAGQPSGTLYTGATGGEKFTETVWLLLIFATLLVGGLLRARGGVVRRGIAVGWLAMLGAEQLISLPVFLGTGYRATGWLYAAWVVWLAVAALTVVAALRDRAASGAPMQPSAV